LSTAGDHLVARAGQSRLAAPKVVRGPSSASMRPMCS